MKKIVAIVSLLMAILMLTGCTVPPATSLPAKNYAYNETKANCQLSGLELYEIKMLYEAAGDGEDAFNAKLEELGSKSNCTRDEFLTAYNHFKDQVIIVFNSKRFIQYDFSFDYAGKKIYYMDAPPQTTSVDMVSQTFANRYVSNYGDCYFYGSSSMDPIYESQFAKMLEEGQLVDARPITSEDQFQCIDKDGYRIDAYVIPYPSKYEPVSNIFYLFVYRDDVYVGFFHIINYNKDHQNQFKWPDFRHFDFMTLEEAIQTTENYMIEE